MDAIYIFDAATGDIVWQYDTLRDFTTLNGVKGQGGGIDSHSVFAGSGMLFVASGYGGFRQPPGNVLLAFRPKGKGTLSLHGGSSCRPSIRISLAACGLLLGASAFAQSSAPEAAPAAANDYSKPETWLCRPGRQDACAVDLTTTVIAADGKLTKEPFKANANAPIDCFYVYPTVSNDATPNSDMNCGAGREQRRARAVRSLRVLSASCMHRSIDK